MKLPTSTKIIKTTVIIDYGATRNFINHNLLTQTKFPLQYLKQPIKAYNVDGTTNSKGNIEWKADILIWFPTHQENVKLMVLNHGWKQIILGMPWLRKWNPWVNWIANTPTIPRSLQMRDAVPFCECLPSMNDSVTPQWYLLQWLGLDADQKLKQTLEERTMAGQRNYWKNNHFHPNHAEHLPGWSDCFGSVQGIWGCILWEDPWQTPTPLTLWPHHWSSTHVYS